MTAGPSLLRMAGSWFGGNTKEVANKTADIVEQVRNLPGDQAQKHVDQMVKAMPAEQQAELEKLANEAARIKSEQKQAELQAGVQMHADSMETIRSEYAHGDDYVKHTRPMLARRSFWAGTIYVFITTTIAIVHSFLGASPGEPAAVFAGPDMGIAGALYSPCVWYFTMRTTDKVFGKKVGI